MSEERLWKKEKSIKQTGRQRESWTDRQKTKVWKRQRFKKGAERERERKSVRQTDR
jgi:hypothetical protein